MLSTNVGGLPGLELFLQQQIMLLCFEHEQEQEEQESVLLGIPWLRAPLSEPKADASEPTPDVDAWTCPRCRSHRCIRVNPGNIEDPVYCCSVCGYQFRKASAARLQEPCVAKRGSASTAPDSSGTRTVTA